MKFILINCESSLLHFGISLGNNTNKMSSNIPSKSMIRGFIGSCLGLSFSQIQDLDFYYSFQWLIPIRNLIIGKNRMVYKNMNSDYLKSSNWLNGEPLNTIDSVEYVSTVDGISNLKFNILIGFKEEKYDYENFISKLKYPEYPIYLGNSDSLIRIKCMNILELKINADENYFKDLFIGSSSNFLVEEILTDRMINYRVPLDSVSVYTRSNLIKGRCINGYISVDDINYCLW